ncbi:FMN-binding negative transcriptional regulator [Tessaracoccus sp. MC1756]|uniref:FMN-binding negative transcriptional regulator n=1 Tax=Tessaracoccus sp. MC1756 TaxID=2760311 RepID=UPI001601DD62|nr:FMN-binding negative transcriptional regulator [Tessaracoccus sp. MC1756]
MHVPDHFSLPEDRLQQLLAEVRPGNLVTVHEDGPLSTFVPMHCESRGRSRVLVTHLVRNNPQARTPITGRGMAILDIADAYVSPHWYATNQELPNVPTWDYLTIHAWGPVRIDPSPDAALRAASALTERMEEPEVLDAVGAEKLGLMSRAIVGVELEIDRIEAKAKMSQNRHPDDIRSLIRHFEQHGPAEVADYLREVSLPHAERRFGTLTMLRDQHRAQ